MRKREGGARTVLLSLAAVGWHLSGVLAMVSLLLREWLTLVGAVSVLALLSVLLYCTWYRSLESKEEARREQEEDTRALEESAGS